MSVMLDEAPAYLNWVELFALAKAGSPPARMGSLQVPEEIGPNLACVARTLAARTEGSRVP